MEIVVAVEERGMGGGYERLKDGLGEVDGREGEAGGGDEKLFYGA